MTAEISSAIASHPALAPTKHRSKRSTSDLLPCRDDLTKGQIDSWRMHAFLLGYLMHPERLGRAPHDQHTAVVEGETQGGLGALVAMSQLETTTRTEAHGSDHGEPAQFGLVITVPADAVLAIAVMVGQHGIEMCVAESLHLRLDFEQRQRPGQGRESDSGIAVMCAGVAKPVLQARHQD